jgi:hypothetical protein
LKDLPEQDQLNKLEAELIIKEHADSCDLRSDFSHDMRPEVGFWSRDATLGRIHAT